MRDASAKRGARAYLPALVVAVVLGVLLGGGALAAVILPDHSVGWPKLTRALQQRIAGASRRRAPVVTGSVGAQGQPGERGEAGPAGPSGYAEPSCEVVSGDCTIYSAEFWRRRDEYRGFETATGVYPEPPACMEAEAEGQSASCPQVVSYLYPSGRVGQTPWVLDPAVELGWRFAP